MWFHTELDLRPFKEIFVIGPQKHKSGGCDSQNGIIKTVYNFRDKWGYCNAGYVVAGEIIKKASGLNWEDYIQETFFSLWGNSAETKSLSRDFEQTPNHCSPYTVYLDKVVKLAVPQIDNLAPAASICSSVSDWAKWVKMILDKGQWNGQQILPEAAINQTIDTGIHSRQL